MPWSGKSGFDITAYPEPPNSSCLGMHPKRKSESFCGPSGIRELVKHKQFVLNQNFIPTAVMAVLQLLPVEDLRIDQEYSHA